MSNRMRDECIALEAVSLAIRAVARNERKTTGQIADEALAKVDDACAKGQLDHLFYSWTHDPEDRG